MARRNLKNIKDPLPDKPSELIFLALKDLRKTERLKNIIIDMGTWLWKGSDEKLCRVCLAGAVMFQTLNGKDKVTKAIAKNKSIGRGISSYNSKTNRKLDVIDDLRTGKTEKVFGKLGLDSNNGFKYNRFITPFRKDEKQFKKDMNQLAKDLRKDGY